MYYTLGFSQRFDIFHRNAYEAKGTGQCGTPYQKSGLVVSFSQTDLQRIPYNVLIEVPITVTQGPLCTKYNSIEVQIIATCEIPTSESQVFQYGIVNGAISYDDADKIYALNDTATFSVAWPDLSSQRRTEETAVNVDNSMLEELIDKKHDNLTTVLKEDLAYSLKEGHNSLASSLKEDLALSLKEGHYSLYSTLNENMDAKFDALMRVALIMGLAIMVLFMTVMLLLYRNLTTEKATKNKPEGYPQALKMP